MKRRGKGEGSIFQECVRKGSTHPADHRACVRRWIGQIDNGTYPTGKRRYARVVRGTQAEVVQALRDLRSRDVIPDRRVTVAAWLRYWLDHGLRGAQPITVKTYHNIVESQLIPRIGRHRLADLTTLHVSAMLDAMAAEGRAVSYQRATWARLNQALRFAQAQEPPLIARNVAALAGGPKGSRAGKLDDALPRDERDAVLAAASGDRFEAVAVLGLRLGLRIGEVVALRWADVDFERGEIHIRRSKTTAGVRTLPLIDDVAPALRSRRAHQNRERLAAGPLWEDTDAVFTQAGGRVVNGDQVRDWWHRLCERAGVGRHRFHACRHTAASLMLDDGVALEVVSAVCGHANLSITSDIYAKVTQDGMRRGLAVLNEAHG